MTNRAPNDTPGYEIKTSPLGGRVHSTAPNARRESLVRHWSGYVSMVRVCPACQWENRDADLFCSNCAIDIREVTPTPSSQSRAGVELLSRRMRRESIRRQRTRPEGPVAGGGWIIVGSLIVAASLAIRVDPFVRTVVWGTGILLTVIGIVQIRRDTQALRGWGIVLGAVTAGMVALVTAQAFDGGEPVEPPPSPTVSSNQPILASPEEGRATVSASIQGSVPMYRGGPGHDGAMPGPAPRTTPRLAWRFDTGGEIYSSPAIADNRIFFTSKSGFLYALDASTGEQIWRFQISEYVVRASPAVVDGVVYVAGGYAFYALDAAQGTQLWKVDITYAGQGTPAIDNGLAVVSSQDGWLYAIDTATGEQRWRYGIQGLSFGAASIAGSSVLAGSDNGMLVSLNTERGNVQWNKQLGGPIFASPAIAGNQAIVATRNGYVSSVDVGSGEVLWTANRGGSEAAGLFPDLVVVAASDGGIYGYDPATGQQRWIFASGNHQGTSPVSDGSAILAGSGEELVALDPTTGAQMWYFLAGSQVETSPVVVDGYVFFGSRDGFLYAVTDRPLDNP